MQRILVVNAGSSSVKFALFDADLVELISGAASEIGGKAQLSVGGVKAAADLPDHRAAIAACLEAIAAQGHPVTSLTAAAHRVVHGGAALTEPCRITPAVDAAIAACIPLAPLHNPANLAAIRALGTHAPHLPQYASFDTGFHAGQPEVATRYAIPAEAEALGIRRYGFHGISYDSLVHHLPEVPHRLLALHLGNGASLCAIVNGRSVATTMGYSPLEGLTMGTRSGGIDANAVLRLAEVYGIKAAGKLLNSQSGLKALGGASDMRALSQAGTPQADFARAHFIYWALRHAGSMIAAMGGIDARAFTGGIGENDAEVRAGIMSGLAFTGLRVNISANRENREKLEETGSSVAAWIIPATEEIHIARQAMALMRIEEGSTDGRTAKD
jgi:acetate kinase